MRAKRMAGCVLAVLSLGGPGGWAREGWGAFLYGGHCTTCHGLHAIASGLVPDLRTSALPPSAAVF